MTVIIKIYGVIPIQKQDSFFDKVNFKSKEYKDQEKIFRQFLQTLKRLMDDGPDVQPPIETVLEVGYGNGRITRIVWEGVTTKYKTVLWYGYKYSR